MKQEIGVIIVFLILILSSVQLCIAAGEYSLENIEESGQVKDLETDPLFVYASDVDSYPDKKVAKEYLDKIHIADATGKPKQKFFDTENIYLKDRRIDETLDEFFARTHRGYNIETQEFMPKYANLYEPNSLVDIYIVFDQDIFESDLSDFFIPRSTPFGGESKTINIFGTIVIRKITVKTNEIGRLPFTNLGKIDVRGIFKGKSLVGKGRTYDVSSQLGNRLRSDPLYQLQSPVNFDIFIDANRDMRWSWIGDLYHSNIVGRGWLREEPDVFLNGETPGFSVVQNPIRYTKTCCKCDKGTYEVANLIDVYECYEYCEKINQKAIGWFNGKCSEAGLDVTKIERKPIRAPDLKGLQFYTIAKSSKLSVPSMMVGTFEHVADPTKKIIAFSDELSGIRDEPLCAKDGQIFEIIPDLMDYNPVNHHLLITTRHGEVYVIEIERGINNKIYGKQIHYLKRVWDSEIAPTGQRPFNSIPTEATMLDNGRIILKDYLNEDYTLIFKTRTKPIEIKADETLTGIKFQTEKHYIEEGVSIKRLVVDEAGVVNPLTDETGIIFYFTPKQIDYNSQSNILGVLTSLDYIYLIQIKRNEFGNIVGEVVQEVRNVREKGLQLEGDDIFYGSPTGIDVINSGDLIIYDVEGKGFKLYLERNIFTDFNIPYEAVLLRGMHFGERAEGVGVEDIEVAVGEGEAGDVPMIEEVVTEETVGKEGALRDAIFLSLLILIVAILIIALLLFEFRRTQRP
ncbi:MAG: hypothetical protein KAT43_04325 [Nanoarchaeota archaeon]|nr:hypothetical protein [Nanoarchaeota archaeon]